MSIHIVDVLMLILFALYISGRYQLKRVVASALVTLFGLGALCYSLAEAWRQASRCVENLPS